MRSVVLGIANRRFVRKAVTGGLGRRVALRFVAGEDLSHALDVIRSLNRMGADVSIDFLGENVVESRQAREAMEVSEAVINMIHTEHLRANLSVKPCAGGEDDCVAFAEIRAAPNREMGAVIHPFRCLLSGMTRLLGAQHDDLRRQRRAAIPVLSP